MQPESGLESGLEEGQAEQPGLVHCSFLTGPAGSGKTQSVQFRRDIDPEGITIAASTGAAAVNMGEGITTIHSLLGFFNESDLQDKYITGRITRRFELLLKAGMRELVVEEISMISAGMLQIFYDALEEAAGRFQADHRGFQGVRLAALGDFLQLPGIGDEDQATKRKKEFRFAFEADCWARAFAPNVTKLTKIWRQTSPEFLAAMAFARAGEGEAAAEALVRSGVEFAAGLDDSFAGTTIMAKNETVDRYNGIRLNQIEGQMLGVRSRRWLVEGVREPSEWKGIPERFFLKKGALVMVLANDVPEFRWANGDLGIVKEFDPTHTDATGMKKGAWIITLKRNGQDVAIQTVLRRHEVAELAKADETRVAGSQEQGQAERKPFRVAGSKKWTVGEVEYFPLRLAAASTVHKMQGLSCDSVQLDVRDHFMSNPGSVYVGLSRARTPEGLRIVGDVATFVKRLRVNERVRGWI